MRYELSAAIFIARIATAHAADSDAPDTNRYASVIQTQYAAQTPPTKLRADEAQRIYDSYLKSIGQKSKDLSADTAGSTDNPPH
jgi:hypothetical protein